MFKMYKPALQSPLFRLAQKEELSASARPWRDGLIIFILAVLATIVVGYFFNFPLRIAEPAVCIQPLLYPNSEKCYPFVIHWANALLDLAFWFVVLAAGWWVVKKLKIKS